MHQDLIGFVTMAILMVAVAWGSVWLMIKLFKWLYATDIDKVDAFFVPKIRFVFIVFAGLSFIFLILFLFMYLQEWWHSLDALARIKYQITGLGFWGALCVWWVTHNLEKRINSLQEELKSLQGSIHGR